jgi:hypothetical protein
MNLDSTENFGVALLDTSTGGPHGTLGGKNPKCLEYRILANPDPRFPEKEEQRVVDP